MNPLGTFFGIGVGPGPAGYLPVAALEALQRVDTIYIPRARSAEVSVARQCLVGLSIPDQRFREIEFTMDPDRTVLREHYAELAQQLAAELKAGRNIAYLTIGDSMTYSTYGYILAALRDLLPGLVQKTFPGVTSYAAAASAMGWSLGEGKERVLILPCPDEPSALQRDIETHDIVVLMKVGKRLPWVLDLLRRLGIAQHCALASRIGLPGEVLCGDLTQLPADDSLGYLSTMLIRRTPREKRHI
ncbi:MAG: precorrin-2 C(20)-methyltransferase [Gammaproteobacteria bacterium]|nr:precorrin-2 C(20)-methyltransferase [Gammaproteobacteria bacterium]